MMKPHWDEIFEHHGVKVVSKTDTEKKAYVLNKAQRLALSAAGHAPRGNKDDPPLEIEILFEPGVGSVHASYYESIREPSERPRKPEARMGLAFINEWAKTGDTIVLGTIGKRIYASRLDPKNLELDDVARELIAKSNPADIFARAAKANGRPEKTFRTVAAFRRDSFVVAAAILRANEKCEVPQCNRELFKRENGTTFLEVHHVTPLAEGGDDEVANTAAVCPACHRELHFGAERHTKRKILAAHLAATTP